MKTAQKFICSFGMFLGFVHITQAQLSVNATASCDTLSTIAGKLTATPSGGTPPYRYSWSILGNDTMNSAQQSNLANGTYTVTVYDSKGDSAMKSVAVACAPSPLSIYFGKGCDTLSGTGAWANVHATGGTMPYSYSWSDGHTTDHLQYLANGTYTVTLTDGAASTKTASVTVNCSILPLAVTMLPACDTTGGTKGNIKTTVVGGTPPYSYNWNLVDTFSHAPYTWFLANGTYTLTVTDAKGDSVVSTAAINCATGPLGVYVSNIYCDTTLLMGARATAIAYGGFFPYTYSWSDGNSLSYNSYMTSGTYSVTVTDGTGTTASTTVNMNCSSTYCKASFTWTTDTLDPHLIIITNKSFGMKQVWDMGDGTTVTGPVGSHTYASPGVYNVCVTTTDSVHSCTDSQCMNLTVTKMNTIYGVSITRPQQPNPTGINSSPEKNTSFTVSPNPANSLVNVNYSLDKNAAVNLELYDLLGCKVMIIENQNRSAGSYQIPVNIEQLNAGIYLLKLTAGQNVSTTRLMVTK